VSFVNPAALLWFLPLAGVIVTLYLLRMRRKEMIIPATFLWPARTEEVRANAPFQKLKWDWLMAVQLLAALLVVLALARPQFRTAGPGGAATVVILDASASMGSRDVAPSRFEEAKRQARAILQNARPADRVALIEAGATPRVVFPLTSDPQRQVGALDGLRLVDSGGDVGEALRLGSEILAGTEGSKIVLLSDGVFPVVEDIAFGRTAVEFVQVGSRGRNAAITALGSTDGPRGRTLLASVRNTGAEPLATTLTLTADGQTVDSEERALEPNATWTKTVTVPRGAKWFTATLDGSDDLAADDRRTAVADDASRLRVLLVTPGNVFLERALALDPRVTLDVAADVPESERTGSPGKGDYDFVVFDGGSSRNVKARAVLSLGSTIPAKVGTVEGAVSQPRIERAEATGIMDGVDLGSVFVSNGQRVRAARGARSLAFFGENPAILTTSAGGQTWVHVSFSPAQSDFPLVPAFPIFLSNVVGVLGSESSLSRLVVTAGQPFGVNARGAEAAILKRQGQPDVRIEARDGRVTVTQMNRVEDAVLQIGQTQLDVSSQLSDGNESATAPRTSLSLGSGEVLATQAGARFAESWKPFLLFLLVVLGLEWWMYARRS